MNILKEECIRRRTDKLIVVEENKSKVVFQNPKMYEVQVIIVDGCAVTEGIR